MTVEGARAVADGAPCEAAFEVRTGHLPLSVAEQLGDDLNDRGLYVRVHRNYARAPQDVNVPRRVLRIEVSPCP